MTTFQETVSMHMPSIHSSTQRRHTVLLHSRVGTRDHGEIPIHLATPQR